MRWIFSKLIIILFFLVFSVCSHGQSSLDNPLKKDEFLTLYKSVDDDNNIDFSTQHLNELILFLDQLGEKIESKSKKKSLKIIFKEIHKKYFIQYKDNPSFDKIFSAGIYNCLTASALYSLVFDYLEISYQIREKPSHVYVVAYPQDLKVIVESTLPAEGLYQLKDKDLKKVREELYKNKIISEEESKSINDDELWEAYVLADKEINLQNLIGLHYFNLGIASIINEDFLRL